MSAAELETSVSRAPRAIALEVLILVTQSGAHDEHPIQLSGPTDEVASRLRELESQGQIVDLDRIRLTTLENQKVLLQAGRDAPVVGARSLGGRGGPAQMSYERLNVGTLISATARVDGDAVVVELEVEKSRLEQHVVKPQADDRFVPLGTDTLTSQVTVRIDNGKTILVAGLENRTGTKASGQLILASARLLDTSSDAKALAPADRSDDSLIKIFSLQNIAAENAAAIIKQLYDESSDQIKFSVDSHTNSLIFRGKKDGHIDVIEAILTELDERGPQRDSPTPKKIGESKTTPVTKTPKVTEYDKMPKENLQEELKKLQNEVLDVERVAKQATKRAAAVAKAYNSVADDEKADALLRMIEADAAGRKTTLRFKQLSAKFDAAKRAYFQLLIAEQEQTVREQTVRGTIGTAK